MKLTQLISETKRFLALIFKIQTGKNLLDILEAPVTQADEIKFQRLSKIEIEKYQLLKEKRTDSANIMKENSADDFEHLNSSSQSIFFASGSLTCLKTDDLGYITTILL